MKPEAKRAGRRRFSSDAPRWYRSGIFTLIVGICLVMSVATAAPPVLNITIGTFSPYYSPKLVHIETGLPISWENPTGNLHSITHDPCRGSGPCAFDSGAIGPNGTFTLKKNLPPGFYPYHCSFHPIMRGALVVVESNLPGDT